MAAVVGMLVVGRTAPGYADAVPGPSTILVDASTGQTLSERDPDAPRLAGTFSHLMVVLLSLEEAGFGALPLDVLVTISQTVASSSETLSGGLGSRIPLRSDKPYVLSDLLKALMVTSANEAAVATAEAIGGSVPACLELMNARAQKLGMAATRYTSLDDGAAVRPGGTETTTARDLARLAQALVQHPAVLQWASLNGLPFDQGSVVLRNVNQLIGIVPGVDGLQVSSVVTNAGRMVKSEIGSFSVVATAQRGALRLIAVVLDAPTSAARYATAAELLEWGFAHYERLDIARAGEPLDMPIRVASGVVSQLTPIAGQTFSLLRRRDEERSLRVRYQVPAELTAPIERGEEIGEVIVEENEQLLAVIPLLSPKKVASTSILSAALR